MGLKIVVPRIEEFYFSDKKDSDLFERKVLFVFSVLIATVIIFESLGMHSIIAGFVIGVILGDSIEGRVEEKIRTISYGLFIPIFFLVTGIETDLSVFYSQDAFSLGALALAFFVVFGLISSKVFSGWLAGKLIKLSQNESVLIGFASIPQLSTTLAVAFAANKLNLLPAELITSLVLLSLLTTFISPLAIKFLASKKDFSNQALF
jgi:Kef-type K+ transport system membrane component KefB